MKAFLLVAVVSTATFAPQAFAQGRNFEGFSVGANATSSSVGTDAKGLGVSDKFGDSSENFGLQAAYGFPMGSNGVLGLGGTYTLADFNAGNISSGSTAMKLKGKNMYSLYVEPGFLVNPSTLIFAKAAYISMKGETSIVGSTGGSENFDGLGYGAGVRMSFGKSAFWQFELTQSAFGYNVIDGVKVPREDEQAVIRQMQTMRQAGAGYRDIAEWMGGTQERKMTFMGVKRTLLCDDAACS